GLLTEDALEAQADLLHHAAGGEVLGEAGGLDAAYAEPSKAMRSSAAANSVPSPLPWAEGSRTQPSSACCPAARSRMSVWEQASCRSTLPTATTAPSCRPTTAEPSLDSQRSRCAASVGLSVVVHSWTSGSRYQG